MNKKKEIFKKIFFLILFFCILFSFYKINEENYITQKQIHTNIVKHPENLPKSDVAKITSFGFKNLRADYFRLQTIQYIGGNAIKSEYKKYLYEITNLITDLNPFFEHPYIIAQLLLPDYNYRYEDLTDNEQKVYIDQAEKIGLKGINNFCELDKVEIIKNEYDLNKIWTDEKYKNPCKSYKIPFYLAYIYYFYKNDPIKSSFYYKLSSANEDSLEGAKILAAIMLGKGGNREKSINMFLTMARSTVDSKSEEDLKCLELVNEIEKIKYLDGNIIKYLEKESIKKIGKFEDKEGDNVFDKNSCSNFLYKTLREINLFYLDEANKKYFKKFNKYAKTPEELLKSGFIDYIPKDFQQYETYGIIYMFNEKNGFFDYEMGDIK